MTPPRVSVVVPVYNKAPVLAAALDSIVAAARSYGNAELIILDHGSTDGSRELLESTTRITRGSPTSAAARSPPSATTARAWRRARC